MQNLTQIPRPGPSMLLPRSGLAAVRLSEVVVLIAGGVGPDGGHLDSTEATVNGKEKMPIRMPAMMILKYHFGDHRIISDLFGPKN